MVLQLLHDPLGSLLLLCKNLTTVLLQVGPPLIDIPPLPQHVNDLLYANDDGALPTSTTQTVTGSASASQIGAAGTAIGTAALQTRTTTAGLSSNDASAPFAHPSTDMRKDDASTVCVARLPFAGVAETNQSDIGARAPHRKKNRNTKLG